MPRARRSTSPCTTGPGRSSAIPVYRLLGLDPASAPITTFSIGIDTPEITRQKVREARSSPC